MSFSFQAFASLGKVTHISYLNPPKKNEQKGEASVFFERPANIPQAFARYEAARVADPETEVRANSPLILRQFSVNSPFILRKFIW